MCSFIYNRLIIEHNYAATREKAWFDLSRSYNKSELESEITEMKNEENVILPVLA